MFLHCLIIPLPYRIPSWATQGKDSKIEDTVVRASKGAHTLSYILMKDGNVLALIMVLSSLMMVTTDFNVSGSPLLAIMELIAY